MFSVITNLQSFGYAVFVWKVPTFILYVPSVLDKHLSTIQIDFLFSVESNTLSLYCKLWHKKNLFVAEAFWRSIPHSLNHFLHFLVITEVENLSNCFSSLLYHAVHSGY